MKNVLKLVVMMPPALVISWSGQSTAQIAADIANLSGGIADAAQTLRDSGMLGASQQTEVNDTVTALLAANTAVANLLSTGRRSSTSQE